MRIAVRSLIFAKSCFTPCLGTLTFFAPHTIINHPFLHKCHLHLQHCGSNFGPLSLCQLGTNTEQKAHNLLRPALFIHTPITHTSQTLLFTPAYNEALAYTPLSVSSLPYTPLSLSQHYTQYSTLSTYPAHLPARYGCVTAQPVPLPTLRFAQSASSLSIR